MKKLLGHTLISFLLICVSKPSFAIGGDSKNVAPGLVMASEADAELLNETCLDEYAMRNKYLKRFIIWAPPTAIVSVPYIWVSIFSDSLASAVAFYFFGIPVFGSLTLAFELQKTIEYLSNRSVIRVVDSLRLGDFKNKYVRNFVNKFRKKFPKSEMTRDEILFEILRLDQKGSLCNGDLTGSRSRRIKKLLAKNKHIFRHLKEM